MWHLKDTSLVDQAYSIADKYGHFDDWIRNNNGLPNISQAEKIERLKDIIEETNAIDISDVPENSADRIKFEIGKRRLGDIMEKLLESGENENTIDELLKKNSQNKTSAKISDQLNILQPAMLAELNACIALKDTAVMSTNTDKRTVQERDDDLGNELNTIFLEVISQVKVENDEKFKNYQRLRYGVPFEDVTNDDFRSDEEFLHWASDTDLRANDPATKAWRANAEQQNEFNLNGADGINDIRRRELESTFDFLKQQPCSNAWRVAYARKILKTDVRGYEMTNKAYETNLMFSDFQSINGLLEATGAATQIDYEEVDGENVITTPYNADGFSIKNYIKKQAKDIPEQKLEYAKELASADENAIDETDIWFTENGWKIIPLKEFSKYARKIKATNSNVTWCITTSDDMLADYTETPKEQWETTNAVVGVYYEGGKAMLDFTTNSDRVILDIVGQVNGTQSFGEEINHVINDDIIAQSGITFDLNATSKSLKIKFSMLLFFKALNNVFIQGAMTITEQEILSLATEYGIDFEKLEKKVVRNIGDKEFYIWNLTMNSSYFHGNLFDTINKYQVRAVEAEIDALLEKDLDKNIIGDLATVFKQTDAEQKVNIKLTILEHWENRMRERKKASDISGFDEITLISDFYIDDYGTGFIPQENTDYLIVSDKVFLWDGGEYQFQYESSNWASEWFGGKEEVEEEEIYEQDQQDQQEQIEYDYRSPYDEYDNTYALTDDVYTDNNYDNYGYERPLLGYAKAALTNHPVGDDFSHNAFSIAKGRLLRQLDNATVYDAPLNVFDIVKLSLQAASCPREEFGLLLRNLLDDAEVRKALELFAYENSGIEDEKMLLEMGKKAIGL